jgi:hypothetical protein
VDAVIDFTSPEAAVENMRAVLTLGSRIVVGTTGWYAHLDEMKSLAAKHGGALLYGTNFSMGVQKLFRLTADLAKLEGYSFSIAETHHTSKLDAPPAPPSPCAKSSRRRVRASKSPSPPTAWETPRANTLSPHPARWIRWRSATTRTAAAALPWAPFAEPSGS